MCAVLQRRKAASVKLKTLIVRPFRGFPEMCFLQAPPVSKERYSIHEKSLKAMNKYKNKNNYNVEIESFEINVAC